MIKGHDGKRGGGNNRTGASGEDVVLLVPPGTQIREQGSDEILADLVEPGQSFTAAAGGRGGKGVLAHGHADRSRACDEAFMVSKRLGVAMGVAADPCLHCLATDTDRYGGWIRRSGQGVRVVSTE